MLGPSRSRISTSRTVRRGYGILPAMDRLAELPAITAWLEDRLEDLLRDLEALVNVDCGSYTPDGVNRIGRWTAGFLERLGAEVSAEPDPGGKLGDTIVGRFEGVGAGRVLLLAHLDTVFDPGT